MAPNTVVAGVGMIPFTKPGLSDPYDLMGEKAILAALADAGLPYTSIQQAYVGYMYADSTAGQAAAYRVGMTGIPIFNVNNACATGSSALFLARLAVMNGAVDCALALGFEQMNPGMIEMQFKDRPTPLDRFLQTMSGLQDKAEAPLAAQLFGGAGREYAEKYGMSLQSFAKVSVKARQHAASNPFAVFKEQVTLDEVLESAHIFGPLTKLQCCPPTCGAAAAIICTEKFARENGLSHLVRIRSQAMTTDFESTLSDGSMMKLIGYDMTKFAANRVYEESGVSPEDIDVVELHDCFTANEVVTYEALGLTPEGTAEKFIEDGDNTYGGKVVTNPSGGLLSKGHPLGATGLAQCYELVQQLRHAAEARQVEGARLGLQQNLGLGGACVVTLYEAM